LTSGSPISMPANTSEICETIIINDLSCCSSEKFDFLLLQNLILDISTCTNFAKQICPNFVDF
jgi:hypothetical protein